MSQQHKSDNLKELIGFISNQEVRQKLIASEDRIRRSYDELFSGYNLDGKDVLNNVVEVESYSGIVVVKDITFYSFCEHHFAPFFGSCEVHYEPNKIITGIGKLVRLVRDVHARRLQIQELMNRDIVMDIMTCLEAKGAYVSSTARHLCMCSRGPSDDNALTTCEYAAGSLKWKLKR